jgi:carbonic anhydrase
MRNIANIVPPFELSGQYHGTSAALDFVVRRLEVQHLVVLGHSNCGGVRAYAEDFNGVSNGEFIGPWLRLIGAAPGVGATTATLTTCRRSNINRSRTAWKICERSPWISARCDAGALRLHGAHFDVGAGALRWIDADSGDWRVQARRQISRDPAGVASRRGCAARNLTNG